MYFLFGWYIVIQPKKELYRSPWVSRIPCRKVPAGEAVREIEGSGWRSKETAVGVGGGIGWVVRVSG